jgi:hypothetical protein
MNTKLSLSLIVILAALSGSVAAEKAYWVSLSSDFSMNRASIANAAAGEKTVTIQRNYDQQINLGVDTRTGNDISPHRSVEINYVVNCAQNKLNLRSMKLFSGNNLQGEVVAADEAQEVDAPYRYSPMSAEEKSVAANVCGTAVGGL